MQPPWSTDTSTMTEPFFIVLTMSLVTMRGACLPGIKTAPITRSAWGEKWQSAVRQLHCFVSDACRACLGQVDSQLRIGSQVQVCEEELSFAEHRHFRLLRLFHLQNQIGFRKDGGSIIDDGRAGLFVI